MHVTLTIETDTGELAVKRSFMLTKEQRTECIQAIATLLNVSIAFVEEMERKGSTNTEKHVCNTCKHFGKNVCIRTQWEIFRDECDYCAHWEAIERKKTIKSIKNEPSCKTCVYFDEDTCLCNAIESTPENACILWEARE